VGALLALVVGLALWFLAEDRRVVLTVGTLLSVAAIVELGRMGRLAGRGLTPVLLAAAFALLLFNWTVIRSGGPRGPVAPGLGAPQLATSYALILLVATAAFVELRFTLWHKVFLTSAALALGASLALLGDLQLDLRPGWGLASALAAAWGVVLLLALSMGRGQEGSRPLGPLGLAVWLVFPLPALVHVQGAFGTGGLAALIVLSKLGDVAGYYVGNAIGKRHPFPRLSPGKTLEGCLGSLVVTTLAGGILAALTRALPGGWLDGALAGLVVNLAAQGGDLLESAVKRKAGVKDSGSWFGPSGGVLDLVDSLLLSVPAALVAWPLIFH
jgi:phosphatidate cytidylyltransferase